MPIKWTEPALDDLEVIQAYIAKDSAYYARQFIERLFEAAKKQEDFPEFGRHVPESEERNNVREIIFQGYPIIYLAQADTVSVITVIHGNQDLSDVAKQPWHDNQ